MASIESIFGGPWRAKESCIESPDAQLLIDIARHMNPPKNIQMDGKIHRFMVEGDDNGEKSGWYAAYLDVLPAAAYGCWRTGVWRTWCADVGRDLSAHEEKAIAASMQAAKEAREAATRRMHATAAKSCQAIFDRSVPAPSDHPYLIAKGIQPHYARVHPDGRLIIPMYGANGDISSVQYIEGNGRKKFYYEGETACKFLHFDGNKSTIFVGEGFATCATIFEDTGKSTYAAFSSHQIPNIVGYLREKYGPSQKITIVADNDESRTGEKHARRAADLHGAEIVLIPTPGDANDYSRRDGKDLAALLAPMANDWLVPAKNFFGEPAPISWLIRGWVQRGALIMIHGASGSGKTYVTLDMAFHIAGGVQSWFGHRVTPGRVIYLAGEGWHGIKSRGAAWLQEHGNPAIDFWISQTGCDLNQEAGYCKVSLAIAEIGITPDLIVVDTMHRFFVGEENSSRDAKSMIDAFCRLQKDYGCAVIVVHHTGLADGAQERGRGSSAFKAALEVEINITAVKGDNPMIIKQKKAKDSELSSDIKCVFRPVVINGWADEDGLPVSSQVIAASDLEVRTATKSDLIVGKHARNWEAAWWHSGYRCDGSGMPTISRDEMIAFLVGPGGMAQSSALTAIKPSNSTRMIGILLAHGYISLQTDGWSAADPTFASSMLIKIP